MGNILLHSTFKPPYLEIRELPLLKNTSHLIIIDIQAPVPSQFKLYYAAQGEDFVEERSVYTAAAQGKTTIKLLIHNTDATRIRIEPGNVLGTYKIEDISIATLDWTVEDLFENP